MAFFSDLVRAVAQAEGMDEATVTGIGQYVRDAGFISKGGRGLSAAKMTVRDAANLLIAVNGTSLAKDAPKAVEAFRGINIESEYVGVSGHAFRELVAGPRCFGTTLEGLIEWCSPASPAECRIDLIFKTAAAETIKGQDRKIVERKAISILSPRLEVEFRRPLHSASIRLMSPHLTHNKDQTWLLEQSSLLFDAAEERGNGKIGDRRDMTIITDQTLRRIAETIYN